MPREDVEHAVVALVAGDLEQRALGSVHRDLDRPRLHEHRRILDRRLIRQRVRVGAREAFDDAQVLVAQAVEISDAEAALLVELQIASLDDECVALEAAA